MLHPDEPLAGHDVAHGRNLFAVAGGTPTLARVSGSWGSGSGSAPMAAAMTRAGGLARRLARVLTLELPSGVASDVKVVLVDAVLGGAAELKLKFNIGFRNALVADWTDLAFTGAAP